ncbi:hypothetical protein K525DRAFT_273430 [Schizophyllum commune Loenen D]|nr:hypothetical protein K525DRAFT_273430 [Schizophyllum commune Loenen D]
MAIRTAVMHTEAVTSLARVAGLDGAAVTTAAGVLINPFDAVHTQGHHHSDWAQDAPMLSPATSTDPETPTSQHHVSGFAEDKHRADLNSHLEQQLTVPLRQPFAPEKQLQRQQQGFDLVPVFPNEQAPFAQQPADQLLSPAYSPEQLSNDATKFNSCDRGQFSNAYPQSGSALFTNEGLSFSGDGPGNNWWPLSLNVFAPDDFNIGATPGMQLHITAASKSSPLIAKDPLIPYCPRIGSPATFATDSAHSAANVSANCLAWSNIIGVAGVPTYGYDQEQAAQPKIHVQHHP